MAQFDFEFAALAGFCFSLLDGGGDGLCLPGAGHTGVTGEFPDTASLEATE